MKPRIANRLVEVLKSGNFQKGEHKLCTIENGQYKYCCLGVLTELYNYERRLQKKKQLEHRINLSFNDGDVGWKDNKSFEYDGCPTDVQKWADISPDEHDTLVNLNDENKTWTKVIKKLEKWGKA